MIAKLEFNTEDTYEDEALKRAVKATDLCLAIRDIQNMVRGMLKEDPDMKVTAQWFSDELVDILDSRGIILDDLIS